MNKDREIKMHPTLIKMYLRVYLFKLICIYIYISTYIHTCIHTHTYIYICTHTHACLYRCRYMYMYMYAYVCLTQTQIDENSLSTDRQSKTQHQPTLSQQPNLTLKNNEHLKQHQDPRLQRHQRGPKFPEPGTKSQNIKPSTLYRATYDNGKASLAMLRKSAPFGVQALGFKNLISRNTGLKVSMGFYRGGQNSC